MSDASKPLEPHTFYPARPIIFGSKEISELVFQPCKAKHLIRCTESKDNVIPYMLELAGFLSGQPSQVIGELEGSDVWEVVAICSDFFAGSQPTGKKLSE